MRMTSCAYGDFFVFPHTLCPFSWSYVPQVCVIYRSSTNSTLKEVGGEEGLCNYSILSPVCVTFSILTQMNFATGRRKPDYLRVRLVNASMNIGHLVNFSRFCSKMSSQVPQCAIWLKHFPENKTRQS